MGHPQQTALLKESTAGELEIYSLAMTVFKTSIFQAGGRNFLEFLVLTSSILSGHKLYISEIEIQPQDLLRSCCAVVRKQRLQQAMTILSVECKEDNNCIFIIKCVL